LNITSGNADWDNIIEMLYEDERVKERLYRDVMSSLIFGRQGFGKNYATAGKIRQQAALYSRIYDNSLDSREMGSFTIKKDVPTTLPQKVCNYRKPKLYWFGELHGSNNLVYNPGFEWNSEGWNPQSRHWSVFQGKRFVGISEPAESEKFDQDSLMRFTGDEIETRTYHKGDFHWSPQAELHFMSGSKLPQIKDKD
jgi:hypothetical protein